jgi:hypothetical protein
MSNSPAAKKDFDTALADFMEYLDTIYILARSTKYSYTKSYIAGGRKYVKIATASYNAKTGEKERGGSVHCFVEKETGDIYKPASWKAPEKNFTRGNIYDLADASRWVKAYGVRTAPTAEAFSELDGKNISFVDNPLEAAKKIKFARKFKEKVGLV